MEEYINPIFQKEKEKFEEMKKEAKKRLDKEINSLKISKFDKGIREEIRRLLRDKKLVLKMIELDFQKLRQVNLPKRLKSLDRIDSQMRYYISLGQVMKQNRTNCLLAFIALMNLIFVGIQIYFGYLAFKTGGT
ncbi:hypothetical protein HYV89_00925 [Candidatus Woesearchaeota archaeon]|nr:hypothetical protein [Candidatus Woesearchaeota archaeon]